MTVTVEMIREVVALLQSHGIQVVREDCFPLTIDRVILCLTDPEAYEAASIGVDVPTLRAWKAYDWRCRARTVRGVRCRSLVMQADARRAGSSGRSRPSRFRPADPDFLFCERHMQMIEPAGASQDRGVRAIP